MRKQYLLFFLITTITFTATAQQQALFSQFFYQKNMSNPAAAGSQGYASLTAFHRQQWAGMEGAPGTQALIFQTPAFNDRVGLGLTLIHDRIGFFNSTFFNAAYAYRVKFEKGALSVGVQGSYLHQRADWGEAKTITPLTGQTTPGDDFVPVFNAGAGIHFENEHFFAGVSIPQLLEKGFLKRYEGIVDDFSGTVRHLFLTAGCILPLTAQVKFRPALAVRMVENAPASTDIHMSFGLLEGNRLWVGSTYRWGQSVFASPGDMLAVMCQYQLNEKLTIGAGYDLSLNELQQETSGTYEFMLEYSFVKTDAAVHNPRFFY